MQWDHAFSQHTLTAIAAYRKYDQDAHAGTYTWLTPLNEGEQFFELGFDQYSAEVRLASRGTERFDYVGGLFLLENEIDSYLEDPSTLIVQTGGRFGRHLLSEVQHAELRRLRRSQRESHGSSYAHGRSALDA